MFWTRQASFLFTAAAAGMAASILLFAQAAPVASGSSGTGKVDHVVREEMAAHKIPGLELTVVQHGRIVHSSAYGLANIENSVPVTEQTIFRINSMSKAFTVSRACSWWKQGS